MSENKSSAPPSTSNSQMILSKLAEIEEEQTKQRNRMTTLIKSANQTSEKLGLINTTTVRTESHLGQFDENLSADVKELIGDVTEMFKVLVQIKAKLDHMTPIPPVVATQIIDAAAQPEQPTDPVVEGVEDGEVVENEPDHVQGTDGAD